MQSFIVLPVSKLSRTASSCVCSRTKAATFKSTSLRSSGSARLHVPALNTRRAAATARSTSAALQWATLAKIWPVAGLVVSNFVPSAASQNLPSIKACPFGRILFAMVLYSACVSVIFSPSIINVFQVFLMYL